MCRSVVHLVEHGALGDIDGDAGAGVSVRRRGRVWREVNQEADGRLSGAVGQLVVEDELDIGTRTATCW